jgi:hypothetical protein
VLQVDGVSYNWRKDEFPERTFGDRTEIGFIAQELEKVFPELVSTNAEGFKSVQYSHMVPVLLEAIKEQQTMIEALQRNVNGLSSSVSGLQYENAELRSEVQALIQLQLGAKPSSVGTLSVDH